MKLLDRLLYEQAGTCFFCAQPLERADASVEHLLAVANGGTSAEENTVACCKALNSLLANKPLKQKIEIFLRQKGTIRCPAQAAQQPTKATTVSATAPPPATPSPAASLRPAPEVLQAPPPVKAAIRVVAAKPPPPVPTSSSTVACPTCKRYVPSAVGQVDYQCQGCGTAFRY